MLFCEFRSLLIICVFIGSANSCQKRFYGEDSFVCVCTEQHCDQFPLIIGPGELTYEVITSSRDELRFQYVIGSIDFPNATYDNAYARILVNASSTRQRMIGFGGAFTDAAGINVAKLSEALQRTLIGQYYSPYGLDYNLGRIPVAGSDFSTRPYSYDDVEGDTDLRSFNLTQEDHLYKIPYLQMAEEESGRGIQWVGSPWSPPSWMKTNEMFNGTGSLFPEMQQPYSHYLVKFLDSYRAEGILLWGLTVQNEPSVGGENAEAASNACYFSGEQERDFIKDFWAPTIRNAGYSGLVLFAGDSSRHIYPEFLETILSDEDTNNFISGIATHWYKDEEYPASILDEIHDQFEQPNLYTEASIPLENQYLKLGSWEDGEMYARNIIENTNHWITGWIDSNLALNMEGGPNWANNYANSPIIVNEAGNEFYKQPMYYVIGQFSQFIPEGSVNIANSVELLDDAGDGESLLDAASFYIENGYVVVIVLNRNEEAKEIVIEDSSEYLIIHELPAKSIQTFFYRQNIL